MDKSLNELVKISNVAGRDTSLVLGTFGNTSVKTPDGGYMYIKASGTALKDMTAAAGWRRLKIEPVLAILKNKSLAGISIESRETKVTGDLLAACDDKFCAASRRSCRVLKPSVETCFHAMLDRYVIHLHPAAVLAYACAVNGRVAIEKLFKSEKFPPLWVPYVGVGYSLAKRIEKLICDYRNRFGRGPAILFLQNHGLVVSANNFNTALRLVHKTVGICSIRLKDTGAASAYSADAEAIALAVSTIRCILFGATGKNMTVRHFIDESIMRFMAEKNAARICLLPAVTPDELVYAGGPPIWLDSPDGRKILGKLNRRMAAGQRPPFAFLVRPLGLFIAGRGKQLSLVKNIVSTYLSVRSLADRIGGVHSLTASRRKFIATLYGRQE